MSMKTQIQLFNTGPECRAKAASLRTISVYAQSPLAKARLLNMALEWDGRAETYEALH
jgi:hypothetical protein